MKLGCSTFTIVSLEAMMINSAIEEHEGRDVSKINIPGAYIKTD